MIYRGFDIEYAVHRWQVSENGKDISAHATEDAAMSAVDALRKIRRTCQHSWMTDRNGLVDECHICGELRA